MPDQEKPMSRAFEGLVVLDLTHVLAGPFCAYQLAVLGADVIKIEPPGEPDCARGRGPDPDQNAALRGLNYQVQAGNKRAMTLDLKTEDGRAILKELVAGADVFIENYRTGALAALGLGYENLAAINPALIHCSMTGFGHHQPVRRKQARSLLHRLRCGPECGLRHFCSTFPAPA
jgi:crotonobetainyl-CoA:carnitine CoA-transferase CaiB-like acyl-CoA transferase